MTKLNDRPVRPRRAASRPAYPRKLSLGAMALMGAMAATAVGCAGVVETAEGDDSGGGSSFDPKVVFEDDNWVEPDGDYAGGIGEEWVDEGGGGAGGEGAGGAGGDGAGGDGAGGDWAS